MKFRLDYTKKGSEEVVDRLSVYIEKWRLRKLREQRRRQPAVYEARKRNTHKIVADQAAQRSAAQTARPKRPASTARRNVSRRKEKLGTKKVLSRVGISVLTFLLAIVLLAVAVDLVVLYGPSKAARDRFVLTVTETSAGKFLATWFLSDETVREIVEGNAVIDSGSTTDTTLIKLPEENPGTDPENPGQTTDLNSIELIDIEGKTFKGKLLIV